MNRDSARDSRDDRDPIADRLNVLESAVQQAAEAVIILEAAPSGRRGRQIVYVNEAFTEMTGYEQEEVLGETLHLLKGPATDQEALSRITAAYRAGTDAHEELLNYRKDGSTFWAECKIAGVRGEGGTLTHWVSIQRDITRRKQAEQALAEMTRIQESVTDVFLVVDPAWQITFANEQARKVLGGGTAVGSNLWDATPEDGGPFSRSQLERAMQEETAAYYETHDPHLEQWFEVYAFPFEQGLSVRCTDITQRKTAEAALVESENRFYQMADASAIMIWMSGLDKGCTYFSKGWLDFTGRTLDEEVGEGWAEGIHPDDSERVQEIYTSAFEKRQPFQMEYRLRRADGVYRWVLDHGSPRFRSDGAFAGFVGSCLDITESKEAEQTVKESAESYQGLFHSISDAIYIMDEEGRFLDVNRGAAAMYGCARDDLLGATPTAFSAPGANADVPLHHYLQAAFRGEPQRFEWWGRRMNGEDFPKEVVLNKGRYFGRDVVIAIARDITEHIRYEDELIEAREQAEEMSRLKSAFLTNMSHEIRTPLTGIIGFAEVLDNEATGETKEMAQMIHESGERLLVTLNSIMDLSQLESGTLELHPRRVDVREEIGQITRAFSVRARNRELYLITDFPDVPVSAFMDRGAFSRVASNLISNAVKFTHEGGVTVSVEMDSRQVILRVADTGVGIDKAFLPHLFKPFRQEDDGLGREFEGNGLGLAITKELTHLMGGTIEIDSTKGVGTTVTVVLPRRHHTPPEGEPAHENRGSEDGNDDHDQAL